MAQLSGKLTELCIEILNLDAHDGILEIYDAYGRKIAEVQKNLSNKIKVNVSLYNTGMYLWRFSHDDQVTSGRFLKN
jgi:hypothetical protein